MRHSFRCFFRWRRSVGVGGLGVGYDGLAVDGGVVGQHDLTTWELEPNRPGVGFRVPSDRLGLDLQTVRCTEFEHLDQYFSKRVPERS